MFSILHIDNSSFFRNMVKQTFEETGYKLLFATDVTSALDVLKNSSVDLIITGIEIKGGGGQTLLQKLNSSIYSNIPVVVVASTDSIEIRQQMFSLGVIDYIEKSATFSKKLRSFVNKYTEESKSVANLKTMRIAVLDDSKMELNIIKNMLAIHKITDITYYSNPVTLMNSPEIYDIYFIDLVLPHISGEHVILKLREITEKSIIIAISSIDNYKVVSNVLLSGADDYILKPFNASIFLARLVTNVRHYMALTELKDKNLQLEMQTHMDSLTDLYNHKFIYSELKEKINDCAGKNMPLSILLLNIDSFSEINEKYGHEAGDKILVLTADLIKQNLRPADSAGRYGGVEFLIILPGMDLNDAYDAVIKIQAKINKIKIKENPITVSCAVVQGKKESALDIISSAEELFQKNKKKGCNIISK